MISRDLSHLRRVFGTAKSGVFEPPRELSPLVVLSADAIGWSVLRDKIGWIRAVGIADQTNLIFSKAAAYLDNVYVFLFGHGETDDATGRNSLWRVESPPDESGVRVQIATSDTAAISTPATGPPGLNRIRDSEPVILPPGDWRLRLDSQTLSVGKKLLLSLVYVVLEPGEPFYLP